MLGQTEFTTGFDQVLKYWKKEGVKIDVRAVDDNKVYFFMGAYHLAPTTFIPVSKSLSTYLQVNLLENLRADYQKQKNDNQINYQTCQEPIQASFPTTVSSKTFYMQKHLTDKHRGK
ncbi:hypothetical protein MKQ70_32640 [Chitinophaga sedimenti]|uniref:hypothetical protein n=1 Tax=Chitinophaga sedimenti TaxID=2033606 RepID=UPI00200355EE|nr:hypothetical protein [Chitinophaga sedimenti]MCK7559465.1 hypothetical protein [Chitinophaga sedimenti]